jgi:hypothetical protein
LPSGRAVLLTVPAQPSRPWMLQASGNSWQLRREHGAAQVHQSPWEHYCGVGDGPLQLSEPDARALAAALNDVIARRPVATRVVADRAAARRRASSGIHRIASVSTPAEGKTPAR